MKAQISLIEMVVSAIVLFMTLTILFPSISYQNRWGEALILLKGRDLVLTIDRIGKLYNFSFDSESLKNFLDRVLNGTNLIYWSETEGTLKHVINVACNCTQEQINNLTLWFSEIKVNNRTIIFRFLGTYLHNLSEYTERSDVLLIWNNKSLVPYEQSLQDYIRAGNGIVEMRDFKDSSDVDEAQQAIFGLRWEDKNPSKKIDYLLFRKKPDNSTDIVYNPYKYFYHIPYTLRTIPSQDSIAGCQSNPPTGNFSFNNTDHKFYICTPGVSVYFNDTHETVQVGQTFTLDGYNFTLNYVDDNKKISVSFKPEYHFASFVRTKKGVPADPNGVAWGVYFYSQLYPSDNNPNRILIKANENYTGTNLEVPAVILNSTYGSRVAWIADFTTNVTDWETVSDDYKNLLLSLILWASNKKAIGVLSPGIKIGYGTSYINSVNIDMFEVYTFRLGLGYPY